MNFIEELKWRGMLHDMTPGIEEKMAEGSVIGYIGFDPTAPSLTIGNYVQLMLLNFFQKAGHKPIVLMGGATGRIGDPSGKDKERQLKSTEELDNNLKHQESQMRKLLDFEGPHAAIVVNNYDFYASMNVLDFLRNVGKNLTVNYMMSKDSVKNRLDSGISFTEFSYQLLQAYDFLCLYRDHNCILQMGGSDQWGNITSGTEFIRRNTEEGKAYAITTPLLTKADGKKFGKSEKGNIWLDPALTSPYQFYQFWLNADDADVAKFYRYFSFLNRDEITQLETDHADNPRALKALLAQELTERIHGKEAFNSASEVTNILFNKKASRDQLQALSIDSLELISSEIPSYTISPSGDKLVSTLLTEATTMLGSKGEVRRAIQNNALSINKLKVTDHNAEIQEEEWLYNKYLMVENGKKNKAIITRE